MSTGASTFGSARTCALLILCFGVGCGDDSGSDSSGVGSGAAGSGAFAGAAAGAAGSGDMGASGRSGRFGSFFGRRGSAGATGAAGSMNRGRGSGVTAGRGAAGSTSATAGRGPVGSPATGAAGSPPATGAAGAPGAPAGGATFTQVYALFTRTCSGVTCHVGATNGGGGNLPMLDRASAHRNLVGANSAICRGERRVVAGNPQRSQLLHTLAHTTLGSCTATPRMPLAVPKLPQADIDLVSAWISAGAPNN